MARPGTRGRALGTLLWIVLASSTCACGDHRTPADASQEDGDVAGEDGCVMGDACIPYAWSCDGDGNPVECSADGSEWIGREACAPGQECDPQTGWCECGPCEVAVDGECVRVGAQCAEGWVDDGECGCEPVLDVCADDEIAVIGGGCLPVGARDDCGTGTWGNIPTDADTIYVDASYSGGGSDGSSTAPFTSVEDAVDAVPDGLTEPRTIAIAAGTYPAFVETDKPLSLVGRCPSMVTILSPPTGPAGIWLYGDDSSVSSLTVNSLDTGTVGIVFQGNTGVLAENVVVTRARDVGIICEECEGEVRNSTVTDIDRLGLNVYGDGITAHTGWGTRCIFSMSGCDIQDVQRNAVWADSCQLEIRNNRTRGSGSMSIRTSAEITFVPVTVTGNVVEGGTEHGIVAGAYGTRDLSVPFVTSNQVRGTLTRPSGDSYQSSIAAWTSVGTATVTGNLVEDSFAEGIDVFGPACEIESNRVSNTVRDGIAVQGCLEGIIRHNTLRAAGTHGVWLLESGPMQVEGNTITDVRATYVPNAFGVLMNLCDGPVLSRNVLRGNQTGVLVGRETTGSTVRENLIEDMWAHGVFSNTQMTGTQLVVESNRIRHTAFGVFAFRFDQATVSGNVVGPQDRSDVMISGTDREGTQGLIAMLIGDLVMEDNLVFIEQMFAENISTSGLLVLESACRIARNRVEGVALFGIMVHGTGDYVPVDAQVVGNHVVGGTAVGIHLKGLGTGHRALFEGNTVAGVSDALWPNGESYGDGFVIDSASGEVDVMGNVLVANARTGMLVAGSDVTAEMNEVVGNEISMAWQDGSDVSLSGNDMRCNGSDQPWVDQGLAVPEPPEIGVPGP